MNEKPAKLLFNLTRVIVITLIIFFGFSWLYYVLWKPFFNYSDPNSVETYFQILGRFFSFNWLDTRDMIPSRDIFITKVPGTRDIALLSLLCGGIPGLVVGLKKRKESKKSLLFYFAPLGFIIPTGVFLSFLSLNTGIFPSGGIKTIGFGSPMHITGSRIIDSLIDLEFLYLIDTIWHLLLPTICISFVLFCLIVWLIRGIKKDIAKIERNWQRINIRVFMVYIIFTLMIGQANFIFNIQGVDHYFYDRLAFRDPMIIMMVLYYITRFIVVYFTTNIVLVIINYRGRAKSEKNVTQREENPPKSFIGNKSNLVILTIIGVLIIGYVVFSILSLLPQFNLLDPFAEDSSITKIAWGIRDSSMVGFKLCLILLIVGSALLIPLAVIRNIRPALKPLNPFKNFLLQFGRDLILLFFIPYAIHFYNYLVVLGSFFGYESFTAALKYISLIPLLILSIDIRKTNNEKINLKNLTLEIVKIICLVCIVILIYNDGIGNRGTGFFVFEWDIPFWAKLRYTWPLANLTRRTLVVSEPLGVIISGVIIWSFYAFWVLSFKLFSRIQTHHKSHLQRDIIIEN